MYQAHSPAWDALDIRIEAALIRLGIPFVPNSFRYLHRMTRLVSEAPEEAELVTKTLYPKVAKEFRIRASAMISAAVRAVHAAYKNGGRQMPPDYFDESGRPLTVSAFVILTAQKLRNGEL